MYRMALFLFPLFLISNLLLSGCTKAGTIEIKSSPSATASLAGQAYIGGQVNVPGIYPLLPGDTLPELWSVAGGEPDGEALFCYLYFSSAPGLDMEQKVDINRAPAWLLQSLPGIGEVTAANIIAYREQNGPFRYPGELTNVQGIGQATFERLSGKITVMEWPG